LNKIVEGAYVISVVKGSPADGAGIQVEDIITEIDNEKVDTQKQDSVAKMILDKNVGQTINIKIYRDKKFINVQVTLKGQS